jgi:putative transposase
MIAFIDDHRDKLGVVPIFEVLPIAPSSHYVHLTKLADPAWQTDRARRDAEPRPHIQRVFDANWQVYGMRKIWQQLRREGFDFARCAVARMIKTMGIHGVIRDNSH